MLFPVRSSRDVIAPEGGQKAEAPAREDHVSQSSEHPIDPGNGASLPTTLYYH